MRLAFAAMPHKPLFLGSEARERVPRGATILADGALALLGVRGALACGTVKAPGFGDWRKVASVLLLTEATPTEAPEPRKEAATEPLG
jgi:hypothetical protein